MAYNLSFARIIAPAQSEHVAVNFGDYCLIPAVFSSLLGDDQIPDANLLPSLGQVGRRAARRPHSCSAGTAAGERTCRMSVSVRGGRD